jgi:hypothetical protein
MSRSRKSVLLVAIGAMFLAAGACTAPATGTTTTTTTPNGWVAAGCIDGAGSDGNAAPDLKYNGTPNQLNNATISVTIVDGLPEVSGNGTCSGQPFAALTIVRAADATAADAVCSGLGAGTATSYSGTAWTLPADAYACSLTTTL